MPSHIADLPIGTVVPFNGNFYRVEGGGKVTQQGNINLQNLSNGGKGNGLLQPPQPVQHQQASRNPQSADFSTHAKSRTV